MESLSTKRPRTLRLTPSPTGTLSCGAIAMALAFAHPAWAQDGTPDDEVYTLDTIEIKDRAADTNPYAEEGAPYKARISGDARHEKPLAETPQTITVLTQTQLQESGKTDMRDILAAQPGISLGTGENGNAFGDRYVIRGHEARSDVFVDGLRDPGMTTRESFATEQVEITKGPSSTFAGRGSTGGAVNSITKQASTDYDFTKLDFGLGTDQYRRLTLDANRPINDEVAVRANFLHAYEQVPDREPADKQRLGALGSVSWTPTDRASLVTDVYYLSAEDTPDLGTYIASSSGEPVKDIPVYLQTHSDFLDTEVQTATVKFSYDFTESLRLSNAARYGRTDNGYITTGARGTTRDASDPDAPGAATISLSTHQGWQEVDYFVDRLDLFVDADLGATQHGFILGVEYSTESVLNGTYATTNTGATNCVVAGRNGPQASYCILDANGEVVDNIHNLLGRVYSRGPYDSDYNIDTVSGYLMDTVDVGEHFTGFFGVRYDYFEYDNAVVAGGTTTEYPYSDGFWNGHVGVVYKINHDGNVYATWSSSSNINGGESDVGGSCGYGGLCGDPTQVKDSKPEQTENYELGTKWNLLHGKLLATAAVFRMTKSDVMENVGDGYETLGTLNTGKNRVEGLELSLAGNLTQRLSAQFGAAFMNSEVLESYVDSNEGLELSNFANNSAFLQLRYQATEAFSFGGSGTYSSEVYAGQPDSAAGYNFETGEYSVVVPDYTVFDAFANYKFNEQLSARLNVGNVFDEDYYLAAYRSGSFTYIGDKRNAQLTVQYSF